MLAVASLRLWRRYLARRNCRKKKWSTRFLSHRSCVWVEVYTILSGQVLPTTTTTSTITIRQGAAGTSKVRDTFTPIVGADRTERFIGWLAAASLRAAVRCGGRRAALERPRAGAVFLLARRSRGPELAPLPDLSTNRHADGCRGERRRARSGAGHGGIRNPRLPEAALLFKEWGALTGAMERVLGAGRLPPGRGGLAYVALTGTPSSAALGSFGTRHRLQLSYYYYYYF